MFLQTGINAVGKYVNRFVALSWYWQGSIFVVVSLALYFPVIGNSFVNDDFFVIRKVCANGRLNIDGFFRPLSDITLYLNYMIAGLNPAVYYLTNIVLHALNTLLFLHFCLRWKWTDNADRQQLFAVMAAILFISYPFHNEPVVWVLGRASLIAASFGILSLLVLVSALPDIKKMAGVALFFFIGMTGYESVMVIPGIVIVYVLYEYGFNVKKLIAWFVVMLLTLGIHFVLRVELSGSITGEYGGDLLFTNPVNYISSAVKVAGRLFLPPMHNTNRIVFLYIGLSIILGIVLVGLWKKIKSDRKAIRFFMSQVSSLLMSISLGILFGVSTNTSESDRFLYFPSFFLCALLSFVLIRLCTSMYVLGWVFAGILIYNILFLQINNRNWNKASYAVRTILSKAAAHKKPGKMYIVNMPHEINGAFVFRVGFTDALLLQGTDTAFVEMVNLVHSHDLYELPAKLTVQSKEGYLFIPPETYIATGQGSTLVNFKKNGRIIKPSGNDTVVYWDSSNWITLDPDLLTGKTNPVILPE